MNSVTYRLGPPGGVRIRNPESDRATLCAVQAAAQGGDIVRASALAERALASGLEHPMLLNLAAIAQENAGRLPQAEATLRRALVLSPDDPGLLNALGLVLQRQERPEAAVAVFDAAIARAPDFTPAHANRATALEASGDLVAAAAGYRHALSLQPGQLVATAGLASIASRRGDHPTARQLATTVLAAEPGYPEAVMALATAELAERQFDAAEARLRAFAADPRPSPPQRAAAETLRGDVLHAAGRYPAAFAAWRAGNDLLRRTYAASYAGDGDTLAYTERLLAYFTGPAAAVWATSPRVAVHGPAAAHVFLIGFPRSGTTLLEQVLASNPAVVALEERETLIDGVRDYLRTPADLDRLATAGPAELDRLRAAYWQRVAEAGADPAGRVFVDKHPLNTLKLPLIARLFPDALILVARRDPRDVVLSCFRRRFRMSAPMFQFVALDTSARFYDAMMRLAASLEQRLGLRQHVVVHEALVGNFDAEVQAVCAAIGIDWTPAMRDFADRIRDRSIATPSGAQLAGGLSRDGIGQWRHYTAEMAGIMPILMRWVARFGYDAT